LGETRKGSREDVALKLKLKECLEFSKEALITSTKLNRKKEKLSMVVLSSVMCGCSPLIYLSCIATFIPHSIVK